MKIFWTLSSRTCLVFGTSSMSYLLTVSWTIFNKPKRQRYVYTANRTRTAESCRSTDLDIRVVMWLFSFPLPPSQQIPTRTYAAAKSVGGKQWHIARFALITLLLHRERNVESRTMRLSSEGEYSAIFIFRRLYLPTYLPTYLPIIFIYFLLLLVGWDWVHLVLRPLLAYCTSPRW
jgi:hypothetical protein